MITYGHENYITQAIESVLMQVCDFEVELIIADDQSPDNTEKIISDIIKTHPNGHWIKYTKHKENKGIALNFAWSLEEGKGKYIALCEGDDYWTDKNKLQKQINFLENNPKYSLSCHATEEVDENGTVFKIAIRDLQDISLSYVLKNGWFIRTNSMVFKSDLVQNNFPPFFYTNYSTDYILQIMLLKNGLANNMVDVMSAYRRHPGGVSQTNSVTQVKRWGQKLSLLNEIYNYTGKKYKNEIEFQSNSTKQNIILYLLKNPGLINDFGVIYYLKNMLSLNTFSLFFNKINVKLKAKS